VNAATNQAHTKAPSHKARGDQALTSFSFWFLLALYTAGRILQVYPGRLPMLAVITMHVVPPIFFTLIHGARFYRWRGILAFIAITLVVGNAFENLGVHTGFPFGDYYFTNLMGPKVLVVPILLGLAYVGMAYLSWTLARLILGGMQVPLARLRIFTLPLVAALIMVSWDLSQDPIWSTILRAWIWPRGGPYFGVPLSNFFGWYLTVFLIYLLFALYLRGRSINTKPLPAGYWRQAVLFYGVSAAGNLLLVLPQARFSVVADPTGAQWKVSDITGTCALVTVFTMGTFALMAWLRLTDQKGEAVPQPRP
jgi:putative membrane protein